MPSLTIKIGQIEVAYEGEQKFIESGLAEFLKSIVELPVAQIVAPSVAATSHQNSTGTYGHTTSQIAQIISASTGPDLIMAAVAHLTLAKGMDKVKREEIRTEIKGASSFYKDTYGSNLISSLQNLIKSKKLNPISDGVYSLPNAQKLDFEAKLKND